MYETKRIGSIVTLLEHFERVGLFADFHSFHSFSISALKAYYDE